MRPTFVVVFLLVCHWATAQELIVRFSQEVSIEYQSNQPEKFTSNAPNIRQILRESSPTHIKNVFEARQKNLPPELANIHVMQFSSAESAFHVIDRLNDQPNVIYAEANHRYRVTEEINDPQFSRQWYLQNINAPQAWEIERGDSSVIVGVIDTGVDYFHEDLQGQLWINRAEDFNRNGIRDSLDFNGVDDDGNGYVDDVIGWDFTDAPSFPDQGDYLDPDNDPMDEFSSGHGTPVAGIIAAAQNNHIGISGASPGASVMVLRAGTASGFLEEDDVAEAILYAIDNGCKVVNMSFGDVAFSYLLRDAIQYGVSRGLIFVSSAGNSGNTTLNYPAAFDQTISVGATNSQNSLASFSSYGSTINLVAPGLEIYAPQIDNTYGLNNGTSFSAPLVCAAIALLYSKYPNRSVEQIIGALYAGCLDIGFTGWDSFFGHGLLNMENTLQISEQGFAEIEQPATNSGTAEDEVAITGTAFGAQIESWRVGYGVGENPFEVTTIAEVSGTQILYDTLAIWHTLGLADTIYTLELRLQQRALPDIVARNIVHLDRSEPQLTNQIDTIAVLSGPQNGYMIRFQTDDPTVATLRYRRAGTNEFQHSQSSEYFHNEHHFLITQDEISGSIEYFIHLENSAGLGTIYNNDGVFYQIAISQIFPSPNFFQQKQRFSFHGFLLPFSTDFNHNQQPEIVISELINGEQFSALQIWEKHNQQLQLRMQTDFPVIPRDAGKIYFDGGRALLAGFGSKSFLFEGNAAGGFPQQLVWNDTTNIWGSRLVNLDDDPELELLALKDGDWQIFDISRNYEVTPQQTLADTTGGNNTFGVPRALSENLDNDDWGEIIVLDEEGDLYIYEENFLNQYHFTWSTRLPGKGGNSLIQAADLTGDGQKELIAAVRNEPPELRESNIDTRYWAITIWKSSGNNQLEKIGQQNILGVNSQTGIQNGLSVADIDEDGTSEIIFTPFPQAFVFQFNQGEFTLLWHRDGVNSNVAVVDDFDGNGLQDMFLNTSSGITQFERPENLNRPAPPVGLQAVPLDTSLVRLSWQESTGASYYKLYRKISSSEHFNLVDSTQQVSYLDSSVTKDTLYFYKVTQVNRSFPVPESALSQPDSAQPNRPPEFRSAGVVDSRQLMLTFNESLSDQSLQADNFLLLTVDEKPGSVIRGQNRHQLLLSFLDAFQIGSNQLQMTNIADQQRTPLRQDTLTVNFTYNGPAVSFYLQTVDLINKRHLRLKFSRPVKATVAANADHYRLEPDGHILSASVDSSDNRLVHLKLAGNNRMGSLGIPYSITVKNLVDRQGNRLDNRNANRFAIIQSVDNLDNILVYPNPYSRQTARHPLMFANLPRGTEIFIFNASGEFIHQIKEEDNNGGVTWDLRTSEGNLVGSGVYLYIARFQDQEKEGKFVILK